MAPLIRQQNLVHTLELWFFDKRIAVSPKPLQARVQVLLFGVFQLLGLPPAQANAAVAVPALQVDVENA